MHTDYMWYTLHSSKYDVMCDKFVTPCIYDMCCIPTICYTHVSRTYVFCVYPPIVSTHLTTVLVPVLVYRIGTHTMVCAQLAFIHTMTCTYIYV
jgi:hypothetical protein